eukprot:6184866-Pleurochrysis_carterae.AAC.3
MREPERVIKQLRYELESKTEASVTAGRDSGRGGEGERIAGERERARNSARHSAEDHETLRHCARELPRAYESTRRSERA